jgi:hypothetical protein
MSNSAAETALLLAVLLKRSGERRARVSEKTLKLLGQRKRLRSAFVVDISKNLADFGLCIIELDAGGFGIVRAKSLEAAKAITVKRLMAETGCWQQNWTTSIIDPNLGLYKP